MAALAEVLGLHAGRPVVDHTGLSGLFDFELRFTPARAAAADAAGAGGDAPCS